MNRRGRLVAVEGIDGSGKSTLVRDLARTLRRRGLRVAVRREPNDATMGGIAARAAAHDPWTGAVYFTVDRFAARSALDRDLDRSDVVLSDRSFYSTLAYQGSALPAAQRARLEALQRRATIRPDRVILLDLPPRRARERRARRADEPEPLERESVQRRVAAAYRRLARRGRWIVVDARRPRREIVLEVADRLGPIAGVARRRR